MEKHCHRNGKLEFLIKWLGYSNRQNTWDSEDYLSPALVQEYFNNLHWRNQRWLIQYLWLKFWTINHLEMLHTTFPCTDMPLNIVVFTYKGTTCLSTSCQFRTPLWLQPTTTLWNTWIPLTEELLPQYVTARSRRINIPRESPTIFSRRYQLPNLVLHVKTVTMTCHYDNIFTGKSRHHKAKSVLLPGHSCLQAGLNHTVPIGHHNKALTKVIDNHWKIPVSSTYVASAWRLSTHTTISMCGLARTGRSSQRHWTTFD